MKNLLAIIAFIASLTAFGQFPDSHLSMLSKINCGLTDPWNVENIEPDSIFLKSEKPWFPVISIDLMTYKTIDNKGGNNGVGVYLFNKQFKDAVKSHSWEDDQSGYVMTETKTYIIVIDYFKKWNNTYSEMVTKLIPELKKYFQDNKDKL